MREKEYNRITEKCLERTKFKYKYDKTYPTCMYYDIESNSCTLNACIKNSRC